MTGIRHHILPRFLQKGFIDNSDKGFKQSGKNNKKSSEITYLYRINENKALKASTRHISVEKYFYGKENSLDADITNLEKSLAILVNELRVIKVQQLIINPIILELITNISTRTKYFREFIDDLTGLLLDNFNSKLSHENNLTNFLLNNDSFNNTFEQNLNKYNLSKEQKKLAKALIPIFIQQNAKTLFNDYIQGIKGLKPSLIKESHNEVLQKNLLPDTRIETYKSLNWFIDISTTPLVLGDIGCLFQDQEDNYIFLDCQNEIKNIFLPISSTQMLIGTSLNSCPKINYESFRIEYIKHCREFFISSKQLPELVSLIPYLGEKSSVINNEVIEEMINNIVSNLK
ncbi:DUF4238 domain-containing protein [Cyanobacterium aponinum]|uniref:DUF4238 domain-containing protein n=1 Tax=Cyanobacterium aponinum TaxID=379064 RepID=UPI000C129D35|nr:DUF4238 domain-containing protein [Cyanobacterium aponinum]PHV63763.1 hypothetical protein CSQ80_04115 [Cyanobacterium aponinum IPPAS B-1201]